MTRHLWDCAGEEKRQNKSASIYFYTADPSAPLHSWQGMELSLDPPNKSLFMRHGNPSLYQHPTWLGLPGQSYFKHHRWLLHLSKHRMEQQMPHHNTAQQYHWGQSWEAHRTCRRATKKRPTGGVQGMGFTGETEQCLPAQRHKY